MSYKEYNNSMISVSEARSILRIKSYTDVRYRIADTSGGNSFGYSFAIIKQEKTAIEYPDGCIDYYWKEIERLIESKTVYNTNIKNNIGDMGGYQSVFDRNDFFRTVGE